MIVSDRHGSTEAIGRDVDESGTTGAAGPYGVGMRWHALFDDLAAQLAAGEERERLADVPDLTRAERAGVLLADRLRASAAGPLTVTLDDGERVTGAVSDAGPQWVLLDDAPREHLVPLAAVAFVDGLGQVAAPPAGAVVGRLTLGHALRAVARDRAVVHVRTRGGVLVGRLDAVGGDHVDVALVHTGSGRPAGARRAVPWSALLVLSRL